MPNTIHLYQEDLDGYNGFWCSASGLEDYSPDPTKATCIDCLTAAAAFGNQAQTRLNQLSITPANAQLYQRQAKAFAAALGRPLRKNHPRRHR